MKSEKFAAALARQLVTFCCGSNFFIFHFYFFPFIRTFATRNQSHSKYDF